MNSVEHVVVLKRTGGKTDWHEGRDLWWHDLTDKASDQHQAVAIGAEDPLFILYTSGSTGKPKGVLHTTGGYLVYAASTFKYVFDYHRAMFTGAPPTSAGSPATVICCTVRWPAAQSR